MVVKTLRRAVERRRSRGFTLVETLVAIVVLTIGVMSLAMLVPYATRNDYRSRVDTTATFLASREMEQILAQAFSSTSFTDAQDGAGNGVSVTLNAGGATVDSTGNIDFTQAIGSVPAGYRRDYVIATGATGAPKVNADTYDIRWNITLITVNGSTMKRIVVAARQRAPKRGTPQIPAQVRGTKMR